MPRDTGVFKIKEQVLVAYTDKHYEAKVRCALNWMQAVLATLLRSLKSVPMFLSGAVAGDEGRKKRGAVVLSYTLYCKSTFIFAPIWIKARL